MKEQDTVAAGKAPAASAPAPAAGKAPAASAPAPAGQTETGFVPNMTEVLASSKSRSAGGAKIRPAVGYTLIAVGVAKLAGTNVPEQEQVILKILNRALSTARPVISEPELNKLVLAAHSAGTLKTKQDAWHIFRYYRTDLIKRGALKQVDIAVAA